MHPQTEPKKLTPDVDIPAGDFFFFVFFCSKISEIRNGLKTVCTFIARNRAVSYVDRYDDKSPEEALACSAQGSAAPPSVKELDLNSSSSGCARLGSGVAAPLGVVEKEVFSFSQKKSI